ncbi:MAG TPA: iron ABC transporter permease [Ilumatobacteraceae bacterium]|nr:iron ABC transporter permease [Ilumatobacteraceae bacterium]
MDQHRVALNRIPRWFVGVLAVAPVVFISVFYAWPVVTLLWTTLGDAASGSPFRHVVGIIWFTLWQAAASTVLTLVVGLLPAYVLARYRFRGRRLLTAATLVPFVLPTVVVGAAFIALLPDSWHGTPQAMIAAHIFFNIAVVVRLVGSMIGVIPHDLVGAARTLGASPARAARLIVLPLLRPAFWSAAVVIFLFSFTSFGVAKLLGGPTHPTLEVEIARRATQLGDVGGAAALSVLQLVLLAIVIGWTARLQRRASVELHGATAPQPARGPSQRRLVVAVSAAIVVIIGTPIAALVARSFRVAGVWSMSAWMKLGTAEVRPGAGLGLDPVASIATSLRYAIVAATIATVVGFLAAMAINASPRAGKLLDGGLMLPLATSAVTIGLGMLITFDTWPVDWRASWWLVPLGHALVAVPFVVRALLGVLGSIPADQRAAAATLGASPIRAWWEVDVRALRRPILAGVGFSAAISLGEFGATTILTRSGSETLPIAIGRLLGRAGALPQAQAFAMATILLLLTTALVTASGVSEQAGVDDA